MEKLKRDFHVLVQLILGVLLLFYLLYVSNIISVSMLHHESNNELLPADSFTEELEGDELDPNFYVPHDNRTTGFFGLTFPHDPLPDNEVLK